MLTFGLDTVPLDNVVVVVGAFESGLHLSELMLHSVQLDTSVLTGLSDFADFFLFFTELKINTFVLIRQLLCQGVLQTHHQNLNKVWG